MLHSGIMCVGGRLTNDLITDEAKHQMLLPKSHHVVDLIVKCYHEECGHSGKEHVLALLRQRFWIVNGCTNCRRRNASCR